MYTYFVNRSKCDKAWAKIRSSPLFGCICVNEPKQMSSQQQYGTYSRSGQSQNKWDPMYELGLASQDGGECMVIYNQTHNNPCLSEYIYTMPKISITFPILNHFFCNFTTYFPDGNERGEIIYV